MSPKPRKDVSQLVENYRRQFPQLERPLLRKLIRLENPFLFKNNPSNLKTLDRHLRKAFKGKKPSKPKLQGPQQDFWKKQAFEDAIKLRSIIANQDPDDLVRIPKATLLFLQTYPFLKEKLRNETIALEDLIKHAYNPEDVYGFYKRMTERPRRLRAIAENYIPKHILEKVFALLYES